MYVVGMGVRVGLVLFFFSCFRLVLGLIFVSFFFFSIKTKFYSLCTSYVYFSYYCDTVVSGFGINFFSALVLAMIAKRGVIVFAK